MPQSGTIGSVRKSKPTVSINVNENTTPTPAAERSMAQSSLRNFMSPTTASLARRRTLTRPTITDKTFVDILNDNPACLTDAERAFKVEFDGKILQFNGKRAATGFERIVGLDGTIYKNFDDFEKTTGLVNVAIAPAFPRMENGWLLDDAPYVSVDDTTILMQASNGAITQRLFQQAGEEHCWTGELVHESNAKQIDRLNSEMVQMASHDDWAIPSGCTDNAAYDEVEVPWDPKFQPRETPWTLLQFGGRNYMDGKSISSHPSAHWDPSEADSLPERDHRTEIASLLNPLPTNEAIEAISDLPEMLPTPPESPHVPTIQLDVYGNLVNGRGCYASCSCDRSRGLCKRPKDETQTPLTKALAEIDAFKAEKLKLSRMAAHRWTAAHRSQARLDQCQASLAVCERDLELVNQRDALAMEGLCELGLLVKKYDSMDIGRDGKAVLGEVRWVLEKVAEGLL